MAGPRTSLHERVRDVLPAGSEDRNPLIWLQQSSPAQIRRRAAVDLDAHFPSRAQCR
jgi:hypothetical protein